MKKVKLKALDLGASKLLSREEQSVVFGSDGSGSGGGSCTVSIKCTNGTVSCSDDQGHCSFIFSDEDPNIAIGIACGDRIYTCLTGRGGSGSLL